jgi:hypothetical protein
MSKSLQHTRQLFLLIAATGLLKATLWYAADRAMPLRRVRLIATRLAYNVCLVFTYATNIPNRPESEIVEIRGDSAKNEKFRGDSEEVRSCRNSWRFGKK